MIDLFSLFFCLYMAILSWLFDRFAIVFQFWCASFFLAVRFKNGNTYHSIDTMEIINKCILVCKDIWMMRTVPFLFFSVFFSQDRHIHFSFHSMFYYHCSRRSSGDEKKGINFLYLSFSLLVLVVVFFTMSL